MNIIELLFVAVALSMDSFAVSLSKGLSFKKRIFSYIFLMSLIFAFFQTIMIITGRYFGMFFEDIITPIGKYITSGIFFLIGIKMLNNGIVCITNTKNGGMIDIKKKNKFKYFKDGSIVGLLLDFFLLGFATSVDAFITGFSFAALYVEMVLASCFVFASTIIFSFIGGWFGSFLSKKITYFAQIAGATILVLLAVKNLLI